MLLRRRNLVRKPRFRACLATMESVAAQIQGTLPTVRVPPQLAPGAPASGTFAALPAYSHARAVADGS